MSYAAGSRLLVNRTTLTNVSLSRPVPRWIGTRAVQFGAEREANADRRRGTDARIDELIVTPAKVACLTVVSHEPAEDSSPEASQVVGNVLARDFAKR
jgi:hypothetical protein